MRSRRPSILTTTVTAASPGTLGEVSGHAFSTRASLPPQVEALVDVIQDPIGQIEFLRKLIPPGFTSGCSSTPMTSPGWSGAEARAGVRPEHHEAVRLTAVPKGGRPPTGTVIAWKKPNSGRTRCANVAVGSFPRRALGAGGSR